MRSLESGDPQVLGRYAIMGRLGEGGMGAVYLGRGSEGELVAIKTVRPQLLEDPQVRERFRREIRAAQRLTSPFVAHFVAADPEDQRPWYATRYIEGAQALDVLVHSAGRLAPHRVQQLAGQLAWAISDVHSTGLVHRDIKPSNVLVGAGQAVLIDLGICRDVEGTTSTATAGFAPRSPGWASPEQLAGRAITAASDVFQWGLVASFMAIGRHPFLQSAEERLAPAQVDELVRHHEPELDELPASIRSAVESSLAKDPEARPSAVELAEFVLAADAPSSAGTGPLPRPPATTGTPPRSGSEEHLLPAIALPERAPGLRGMMVAVLAVVAALVVFGGLANVASSWLASNPEPEDSYQTTPELGGNADRPDNLEMSTEQPEYLPSASRTVDDALRVTAIPNIPGQWMVALEDEFDPNTPVELDKYGDPYLGLLQLGAVDATSTTSRVILEGVGDTTVTVTGAKAIVTERQEPWDGADVMLAGGGEVQLLGMVFELDDVPARAQLFDIDLLEGDSIQEDFFARRLITVEPGEVVGIDIETRTQECYCEFFVEFSALHDGEEFQFRVGDGDYPFRVSAGGHSSPDDQWFWNWMTTPSGFVPTG